MSDSKHFPSSSTEALAMLWLQNQDLKGKTPEEIQAMYYEAYFSLDRDCKANRAKYMEIKHRTE